MAAGSADENDSDELVDSEDQSNGSHVEVKHVDPKYHSKQSDEKTLWTSLQDLEADDLSLHLFCSYHLKRRLYDKDLDVKPWQCKSKRIRGGEKLPRKWTVWPLPPNRVPRESDVFGSIFRQEAEGDEPFLRSKPNEKSSAVLAEILQAEATKRARSKFVSRQWDRLSSISNETGTSSTDASDPQEKDSSTPIAEPMIDDEKAEQILQPSVRHILSKLDDLLLGLHKARVKSFRRNKYDESKAAKVGTVDQNSLSKRRPRQLPRIFPRDWSDILGVACMTGWDSRVVNRTQERCVVLLEETMRFRNLNENAATDLEAPFGGSIAGLRTEIGTPAQISHESKSSWKCPNLQPSCREMFSSLEALKNHTLERHAGDFEYADFRHRKAPLSARHVLEDYTCPDPACQAHYMAFSTRQLLQSHVTAAHEDTMCLRPRLLPFGPSNHGFDEMHGGVHVDGFLEPVSLLLEVDCT